MGMDYINNYYEGDLVKIKNYYHYKDFYRHHDIKDIEIIGIILKISTLDFPDFEYQIFYKNKIYNYCGNDGIIKKLNHS